MMTSAADPFQNADAVGECVLLPETLITRIKIGDALPKRPFSIFAADHFSREFATRAGWAFSRHGMDTVFRGEDDPEIHELRLFVENRNSEATPCRAQFNQAVKLPQSGSIVCRVEIKDSTPIKFARAGDRVIYEDPESDRGYNDIRHNKFPKHFVIVREPVL